MKTITKIMTNGEIYNLAVNLINNFNDNEVYMPAAVAYSIQKNKSAFAAVAEEIEKSRMSIIQHYSKDVEGKGLVVPQDSIEMANAELMDLLAIEQEITIYMFEIEKIENIQFTSLQIQAIMFMIED